MAKGKFEIEENRISMDDVVSEMVFPNGEENKEEVITENKDTTKVNNKDKKTILVAMRINPEKWEDLKLIARVDGVSLSSVLSRLIDKEINHRKSDIKKLLDIKKK